MHYYTYDTLFPRLIGIAVGITVSAAVAVALDSLFGIPALSILWDWIFTIPEPSRNQPFPPAMTAIREFVTAFAVFLAVSTPGLYTLVRIEELLDR